MQFRELEYVVTIAKTQSIGKAAKELNVSQPTLSKFVQNIEASLGNPLFSKHGNKFYLTYFGETYVNTAQKILNMKYQLDHELSDIKNDKCGEIRVAFRMCGGLNMLPIIATKFWQKYPNVSISVIEEGSDKIEESMKNGLVDLAFMTLPSKISGITYEQICKEEVLLIMPSDHKLASTAKTVKNSEYPWINLKNVQDEYFILQQEGHRTRQAADELFFSYGIKPKIRLSVSNIQIAAQLVSEGFGMMFAGEVPFSQMHTAKPLSCFSVGNPKKEFEFAVSYRDGMYISSPMREFIDIAKEVLMQTTSEALFRPKQIH